MKDKFVTISEEEKEERWDSIHLRAGKREEIKIQYDGWLESNPKIAEELKN